MLSPTSVGLFVCQQRLIQINRAESKKEDMRDEDKEKGIAFLAGGKVAELWFEAIKQHVIRNKEAGK